MQRDPLLAYLPTHTDAPSLKSTVLPLPLHGGLPQAQQARVFDKTPLRKVIVATNVAETSITIDDCTVVVDWCRVKQLAYDPTRGITQLITTMVSKVTFGNHPHSTIHTQPLYVLHNHRQQHNSGVAVQGVYSLAFAFALSPIPRTTSLTSTHYLRYAVCRLRACACKSRCVGARAACDVLCAHDVPHGICRQSLVRMQTLLLYCKMQSPHHQQQLWTQVRSCVESSEHVTFLPNLTHPSCSTGEA